MNASQRTGIEKNLLNDEQILYQTKKHWITFLAPVCWTIVTFIFMTRTNHLIQYASYGSAVIALLAWLNQFLLYSVSAFVITNKRVMMREGFLYRRTQEARLSTVTNVAVNQSLIGQALGYGNIFVSTPGNINEMFTEISNPLIFQKMLQDTLFQP